jgi:hypothetical protein
VKFRALDNHILEGVKSGGGEAEDDSELEEESDSDKEEVDDDAPTLLPTVTPGQATAIEINPLVDITAPALLDKISEKPVQGGRVEAAVTQKSAEVGQHESVDWAW